MHRSIARAFIFAFLILLMAFGCLSLRAMKSNIRKDVKDVLKILPKQHVESQSKLVTSKLFEINEFQACKSFSMYLSMPGEVDTNDILHFGFSKGKKIFIPKVLGKRAEDMVMIPVLNAETVNSFPKNSWGIPEPPLELIEATGADGT